MDNDELFNENAKLRKENKELMKIIEELKAKEEHILLEKENYELKNIIKDEMIKEYENKHIYSEKYETNQENMKYEEAQIISLLHRSSKRIKVLESLEKENKIPSQISKDINDSSYNISKYLKILKEYGLVICLNENDKRYRYYTITDKGRKYLDIIKNEY